MKVYLVAPVGWTEKDVVDDFFYGSENQEASILYSQEQAQKELERRQEYKKKIGVSDYYSTTYFRIYEVNISILE